MSETSLAVPRRKGQSERTRERIEFTILQLQRTVREATVVEVLAAKYGITHRQARRYVRKAWDVIRERRGVTRPFDVERMEQMFEALVEHAISAGPVPGALSAAVTAADRLAKIRGVYAPEKVQGTVVVGGTTPDLSKLSDEELALWERLAAKSLAK